MILLILHNIRSAHNVGSIFRTADAAGVAKIYLCGYTPAPLDRFGRIRKDIAKVSLGAERVVPWETRKAILPLLRELKAKGVRIVAVEQHPHSIPYTQVRPGKSIAVIVGNEVIGIPERVLCCCDIIAEIPMRGGKESLNVSVAAGIILFSISEQWRTKAHLKIQNFGSR